MKTELSPLEALKRIKSHYNDRVCIDILEDFDIIETALKDYEELKKLKLLPYPKVNDEEYRRNVIKRIQALEIIKEKIFNKENFDWYDYNDDFTYVNLEGSVDFTKEEAELLKEVLL